MFKKKLLAMVVRENVICFDKVFWVEASRVTDAKGVILDNSADGSPNTKQIEFVSSW